MDHEAVVEHHSLLSVLIRRSDNPAAAVYGIVICSAVLAIDSGLGVPTVSTIVSIEGALLIYWLAEAYAHLVTSPPERGGPKAWLLDARHTLAVQSPLVVAPLVLIGVLLVARLAGASPAAADIWALIAGIVLLGVAGARGAVRAGRNGAAVVGMALLGASFGVAAIGLKIIIHSAH